MRRTANTTQRLIIGDMHGSFDELHDFLAHAGLAQCDEIIALGDIVDTVAARRTADWDTLAG